MPIVRVNLIALFFLILNSFREPAIVKANAITAASEATCLLLSVDETVKNPRSDTQVIETLSYVVATKVV